MQTRPDIIASAVILFISFITSLFFTGLTTVYFATSVVGIFAIFLINILNKGVIIPNNLTGFAVLAWWFYILVSSFWATIPFNSLIFLGIFSILPILFLISVAEDKKEIYLNYFRLSILIAITGLAFGAIIQFLFYFDIYGPRIHLPLLNPNTMAGIFAMALLPIATMFISKDKGHFLYLFLFAVLFFALLTTYSRGAMLSVMLGGILILLFSIIDNKFNYKHFFILLLSIAILFSVYYLLFNMLQANISTKSFSVNSFENIGSLEKRFAIWNSTIQIIKENPIFGVGLGAFYAFYPKYRSFTDISAGNWAHNDILQFGAELGIVGIMLFLLLLTAVLFRTIKALRLSSNKLNIIIPFASMFTILLHSNITFHLYQPAILIPLGILFAWWYLETDKLIKSPVISIPLSSNISKIIILVIFLSVSSWQLRAGYEIYLTNKANTALQAGELERFAELVEKANKISPSSYIMPKIYVASFHLTMLETPVYKDGGDNYQNSINIVADMLKQAEKQNPKEPIIKFHKARLSVIKGDNAAAQAILRKTLEDNPRHIKSRMLLADLLSKEGEKQEALEILEAGLVWAYAEDTRNYYQKVLDMYLSLDMMAEYKKLKEKIEYHYKIKKEYPNVSIMPVL